MRGVLGVGALVLVLAGCGSESVVVTGTPGTPAYDGPMSLPLDDSDDASVLARSGAAGRALECDGDPYFGGGSSYEDGLASTQATPEKALADLFGEDPPTYLPRDGYRVERRDHGRVLFSYDVGGRTKAALVAADGISDWKQHTGWGIEAWAQCDPAEFPPSVTDELGLEIWTDRSGARVPVTEVASRQGPAHCDWQEITFLEIGEGSMYYDPTTQEYLRDPKGELGDLLRGTYDAHATLPKDATDTGWRHDGRELWLVPDRSAAYLVSLEDASDVERWPASKRAVLCS